VRAAAWLYRGHAGLFVFWHVRYIFVQKFSKRRIAMAEEKAKAVEKDQETKPPAGVKKDELSEEDLKKAAGGVIFHDDAGTEVGRM